MTVWRIKDQGKAGLKSRRRILYRRNLKILPNYFHRRILLIQKLSKKFKKRFGELLPPNFPLDDFLVEIMGEVWG